MDSHNLSFLGKASYLSFSDYGAVIGVLLLVLTYFSAIAKNQLHFKVLKWNISLIWLFFLFEFVKALSNYNELFIVLGLVLIVGGGFTMNYVYQFKD